MALKATIIATGQTLDLSEGDEATLKLIESLRSHCPRGVIECREHDGVERLRHRWDENGQVHGAWLYVRRLNDDVLLLCHNGHNDPELKSESCTLRVSKSAEHQYEQDALHALGERVGYTMSTEHPVRNADGRVISRLDVHGVADQREFGIEVQLSQLSEQAAKTRDTKALKAGIPVIWTAKGALTPWARRNAIANVATNDLQFREPLERWRIVSGLRKFRMLLCREFNTCPDTGTSRDCRQRHPLWVADVDKSSELRVADFLERYGDGRIVRLDTRTKQGVFAVEADVERAWNDLYPPALPPPRTEADTERDRPGRNPCEYGSGKVDRLPTPSPRASVERRTSAPATEREVVHVRRRDDDDSLLARPGVMRANWWSICRGCDQRIEAGDVQGLADLPTGRAWVCRGCLLADVLAPRGPVAPATQPANPLDAAR